MRASLSLLHLPLIDLPDIVHIPGQECGLGQHGRSGDGAVQAFSSGRRSYLLDDVQGYQTVRELCWPDGITCPSCASQHIIKRGFDDTESARQRYECHDCDQRLDGLTDTIFAGHHQLLKVWVLCLYFMGLNVSNEQIGSCCRCALWCCHPS